MAKREKNTFDFKDVELKMPEENFLESEPTTKTVSLMPLFLFGIILLLIGVLGGLLWWGSYMIDTPTAEPTPTATRPTPEENNEPESTNAEADVQIIQTVSSSDEIESIESDIYSTDIEGVDVDLQTIDSLLNS